MSIHLLAIPNTPPSKGIEWFNLEKEVDLLGNPACDSSFAWRKSLTCGCSVHHILRTSTAESYHIAYRAAAEIAAMDQSFSWELKTPNGKQALAISRTGARPREGTEELLRIRSSADMIQN
jgi:hypothetical protein